MSDTLSALRQRIKVANDLGSVVKTMKAMAASSITQYEQALESLEVYSRSVELSLAVYYRGNRSPGIEENIPNHQKRDRTGLLVIGTDQGMVGTFNEALAESVVTLVEPLPQSPVIWVVGERIQYRLENAGIETARAFPTPNSIDAVTSLIADVLRAIELAWSEDRLDEVTICFNKALSRSHYEVSRRELLPLDPDWVSRLHNLPWPTKYLPELIDESEDSVASFISEFLYISLFKACTESLAAENGARLSAMQRAEKNIDERLREFHLAFNHQRQKAIDEELFDLLSGFESLSERLPTMNR